MAKKGNNDMKKWINLGVAVLAIIGAILPWLKVSVSLFGYSYSETGTIFKGDGAMFTIAKIVVVIAIIAAILTIVNMFVDLKKTIKPLEKLDVAKLAPIVTYGLFTAALVFALIGIFTAESYSFGGYTIGWGFIVEAIIVAAGLVLAIKPSLLDKVIKTK